MKYCEYCKVDVNENLENCPLCGSYLSRREGAEDGYYAKNIQPLAVYPKLVAKTEDNNNFLQKKFLLILIFVVAACVAINLLIVRGSLWSAYVGISAVVLYACVITSIYRRSRLYSILFVSALFVSLSFAGYDIVHSVERYGTLEGFGVSLEYIIPAFLLAMIVATDALLFVQRTKYKYYFVSLVLTSVIALVPQILMWSVPAFGKFADWLTFSLFFFSILNILILSTVCLKGGAKAPAFNFFISKIQDTSTARRTSLCAPLRPLLCTRLFLLSIGL